jgi:predicted transcriptional regulator
MTRLELLQKIKNRRKDIGITMNNLSFISEIGTKTLARFFTGADVKLSTVERITQVLGLDFAGNEVINIKALKEKRAEEKALYIVSLVQDTSALEMQGLESNEIKSLIEDTKKQFLTGKYKNTLWIN